MTYCVNNTFQYQSGFTVNSDKVLTAVYETNETLIKNPVNLYRTIDLKTTSAILGAVFCGSLANTIPGALVNPIEKGHPDIIPHDASEATEAELRNYPMGLEVKTTAGNVRTGSALQHGQNRLNALTGITWQAHHQEVQKLMGIIWDFDNHIRDFLFPMITGVFFSSDLCLDDWGAISGTTGRNTKVCGMTAAGRRKMKRGWIIIHEKYFEKYNHILGKC